ncbi:hypothetical protein Pint_36530 [Pistacia integerrima]|uniref:Uncharacterized protein n=1 Tax=Pistacia integerrima TaxID=434235 RepID=A0ACC0Y322_9ROSI|nr:hypothetical protein Pint_36530 [Pistacia integerrima]
MEAVTRVQNLTESKLPHVPAQYIQPLHDRPTTQNSSLNIPVIDLSTPGRLPPRHPLRRLQRMGRIPRHQPQRPSRTPPPHAASRPLLL